MKETAKTMAQIPHMDLSDFSGDEQDRERERLYRQFEDVRNLQGEDLDLAKKRVGNGQHECSWLRDSTEQRLERDEPAWPAWYKVQAG